MSGRGAFVRLAARLAPPLLFAATPLLVFPLGWLGAGAMDPKGDDTLGFFPYLVYSARAFFRGDLLWTDSLFLGTPLLAQPEFAVFYPVRLFIPLFPPVAGYTLYVVAHYVIAQLAMYAYVRQLGAARIAAALAGVAYGYSAVMMGHRGHANFLAAAAWAPLFFFFVERALRRRGRFAYLGAALTGAVAALAGAFQLFVYLASAAGLLAVVQAAGERRLRPLWVTAGALVAAGLVAALQALPSLDLAGSLALAGRGQYDIATTYSWHPLLAPSLFAVDAFAANEAYSRVGALVLVAAISAAAGRFCEPRVRGWTAVAAVALVLMTGKYIPPLMDLLLRLPVVDVFRSPVRHHFELAIAAPVLAGLAVDAFVVRGRRLPGHPLAWAAGLPALLAGLLLGAKALAPYADLEPIARGYLRDLDPGAAVLPAGIALFWALAAARRRWPARLRGRLAPPLAAAALLAVAIAEVVLAAKNTVPADWADRAEEIRRADFRRDRRRPARIITVKEESAFGVDTLSGTTPLLFDGIQRLAGFATAAPRDAVNLLRLSMQGAADDIDDLRWSRLGAIFGVTHLLMPAAVCQDIDFTFDQEAADTGICANALLARPLTPARPGNACMLDLSRQRPTFTLRTRVRGGARGALDIRMGDDRRQTQDALPITPGGRFRPVSLPLPLHEIPPDGMLSLTALSPGWVDVAQPFITVKWGAGGPEHVGRVIGRVAGRGSVGAGVRFEGSVLRFDGFGAGYKLPYYLPRRPLTLLFARGDGSPAPRLAVILEVPAAEASHFWRTERVIEPAELTPGAVLAWSVAVPPDLAGIRLYVERLDGTTPHAWVYVQGMDACRIRRIVSARPLANGLWLYASDEALPRAYAPTQLIPARDAAQTGRLLRYEKGFVPGDMAVVRVEDALPRRVGPARILRATFGQERLAVEVDAPAGPAFVVVNDRFDPGWEATVDGTPARVYRVNGLVRGVRVPAGRHTVRMRYRAPRALYAGIGCAAAGLLLALVVLPLAGRPRRRRSGSSRPG